MATKINIQIPTYGKEESKERKVKYEVVFSHIESAIKEILLSNDCGIPYHWLWFCV
jgi:hypothetical protein